MTDKIDVVGSALSTLIEEGKLERDKNQSTYDHIMGDVGLLNDLETVCSKLGLYLNQQFNAFYVSPIPGSRTFGYSNDELKKAFGYYFMNEDMYMALFIIATIVVEFFPEANIQSAIKFLKVKDLIEIVDSKIDALRNQGKLEEMSQKQSYNFDVVVRKWMELPMIKVEDNKVDDRKAGKQSKTQIVNTTLKFLELQQLISQVEINDRSIFVTERFQATVSSVYNSERVQSEIYSIINSLKEESESNI